jgi:predicted acylesterase/phospholipase RssA
VIVYIIAILSYEWSVAMGSFATVLLAFGVLTGMFSIITFFSVVFRVNFHVVIVVLILLFGGFFEPHRVTLIDSKEETVFKKRPGLREYFDNWTQKRKDSIEKGEYPILFTLADGGASRSGYWTAATLSKLEDTTGGKFSQHLFCLSGASGGSVGNGTFLALLKLKDSILSHTTNFTAESNKFLKSDFLSYTLARMLGPDFVRPMFGGLPIADRAAALEYAMENGEDKSAFLYQKLATPFSKYIPDTTNNLPILCINVTRVQDGCPSVVSNIRLERSVFGQRVDILDTLPHGKDMKLSTAVALGARFPYISPGGRINKGYYVDGGYFDNSGSGVVQEMIIELQRIIKDSLSKNPNHYFKNLSFYVIHSQNGYPGGDDLKKIHPLFNDLATPVLTLVGAFGTQTSVNDWRLIKYMQDLKQNTGNGTYMPMNLYKDALKGEEFPMNWAISNYYINKMDAQLLRDGDVINVINTLKARLR